MSNEEEQNPSSKTPENAGADASTDTGVEKNSRETSQERFHLHQLRVADQERANRIKAQDLIQREQKLEDERRMINQERKMLTNTRHSMQSSRQRRTAFMLPLLLVAAIAAGLMAYRNLEQQQKYFDQVSVASKNIDTLAQLLSATQDEVVMTTSKLSNKQFELERTKSMLFELKQTTDQLQGEIRQLRGDTSETAEEKSALTLSAGNLSDQLAMLQAQLEDKYLNDDINEVFIEYQQNDLKRAQQKLEDQSSLLSQQAKLISELKTNLARSENPTP